MFGFPKISSDLQRRSFFFFLVFTYFWGQILKNWPKSALICGVDLFFGLHLLLGKDPRYTSRSEHRFCATNLQLQYMEFNLGKNACGPQ